MDAPPTFVCDGSLGGLARWLRALGYEASWEMGLTGDPLLQAARARSAIVLTTDARLRERRVIADGTLRAVWLPSSITRLEQLRRVRAALGLLPRDPRCMACGGALSAVDKQAVLERIPPRTARWKDEYFACERCGRLFWKGTHWERIARRLAEAAPAAAP